MIKVERSKGICEITLNRPECRNALSLALLAKLADSLSPDALIDASAVVIGGAGSTFSAGADLADLTGTVDDLVMDVAIAKVVAAIIATRIPVVAAIDGPCIGGAVDIAFACDVRVATEGACFKVPATRLGLLYNPAAIVRMHAQLSRDVLDRLLVRGETFSAGEALAAGLLTHVSPKSNGAKRAGVKSSPINRNVATAATEELLDDLDSGDYDSAKWEKKRREILGSPERAAAIQAAAIRKRPL